MKIIQREDGLMLIEQYNKTYIRFVAGEIAEILYQVPITSDEKEKIISGEYSMGGIINSYSNRGDLKLDSLMDNLVKDYLKCSANYSDERKNRIIKKLHIYSDIFYEFYYYVLREKFEEGIVVEGFSAKRLNEEYHLSALGAYNYLIYLREDPQNAILDLKKGLPRK